MKNLFTHPIGGSRRNTFLAVAVILFVTATVFFGCYKFRKIYQPSTAYTNSYFDVPIVCQRDDDPNLGNGEWANTLQNIGLFGVMIPDGWNVKDSIPYTIISKNPELNNSGFLVFNLQHTKTLKDSIPPFAGYHWWGAVTDRIAELTSLDSFYFAPRIITDSKTGTFTLRYAVGDKDYWDRNPADRYNYGGGLSDPIPITISSNVGVGDRLTNTEISVYPNPTEGLLHININGYRHEVVHMDLLNSSGKVVLSEDIMNTASEFSLDGMPKGVYIVRLQNGLHTTSRTIVLK